MVRLLFIKFDVTVSTTLLTAGLFRKRDIPVLNEGNFSYNTFYVFSPLKC